MLNEGTKAAPPFEALTRTGGVQLAPPSSELQIRTSSYCPALRRASCHATYSRPVRPSMAGLGIRLAVRTAAPVPESTTPTVCKGVMMSGSDHVSPPSVDFWKATLFSCSRLGLTPLRMIQLKTLYRVPVRGSIRIRLPNASLYGPGRATTLGSLQLPPPSSVSDSQAATVKKPGSLASSRCQMT